MKEINLKEILCKKGLSFDIFEEGVIIEAMKEACKQTLELATENAKLHHWSKDGHTLVASSKVDFENYGGSKVDKQSILNTINQIK